MDLNFESFSPDDPYNGLPQTVTADGPKAQKTFAKYLQDNGYNTGMVGKWQQGAGARMRPRDRGFDYFFGFLPGGHDYIIDLNTQREEDEAFCFKAGAGRALSPVPFEATRNR